MKLPRQLLVGRNIYKVEQPEAMRNICSRGDVDYRSGVIKVAHRNKVLRKTYTPAERREVFWHELTHAVLHEMCHELYADEAFVTQFAKVLSRAIDSATFD